MTEQPTALRLAHYWSHRADELQTWVDENDYVEFGYRPEGLKKEQDAQRKTAAELRRLSELHELYQDKVQRLTDALKKANDQAEHFEREWYLRGDANQELLALVKRYRAGTPLGHQPHMIASEADAAIAKHQGEQE